MRDANILTPADIKAQDDAQAARDLLWMAVLLGACLALLLGVFAWALWSVR